LVLGGPLGRDQPSQQLSISLDTDSTTTYPFTVSSPGTFATRFPTSGAASTLPSFVSVFADTQNAPSPGSYSGSMVVSATVNGDVITKTVPVTYNTDVKRLVPAEVGVAFVKTPTLSRLSRQIHIADSFGGNGGFISATDKPWLTASLAFVQGSISPDLLLTADPTGLPQDTYQTATATVRTGDGSSIETIQVGFWIGSSNPTRMSIAGSYGFVRADPVRPLFYVHEGGSASEIVAFNTYTGVEAFRMSALGTQLGEMDVSPDGSRLYVVDQANQHVVAVDLVNRIKAFDWATGSTDPTISIRAARVNGINLVFTSTGRAFNALDGTFIANAFSLPNNYVIDVARDGKTLAGATHLSPTTLEKHALDWSGALTPHLVLGPNTGVSGSALAGQPSNALDLSFSSDSALLYVGSQTPTSFQGYATSDLSLARSFPGSGVLAAAVEVTNDGRVAFASSGVQSPSNDFWIYSPSGTPQFSTRLGDANPSLISAGGIAISGDGFVAVVVVAKTSTSIEIVPIGP
jgi:hypothetical protein